MNTKTMDAPVLTDHQIQLLSEMLEEQEQFRTQQIAQLTAAKALSGRRNVDVDRQIRAMILAGARAELAGTRAARARLRDGTFGRCGRCTARLQLAQLEALPHSLLCVRCRRDVEQ
jgi:DnaK suppressor protein